MTASHSSKSRRKIFHVVSGFSPFHPGGGSLSRSQGPQVLLQERDVHEGNVENRLDVAPGNQAEGLEELAVGLAPPRLAEGFEVVLLDFAGLAVEAEGSSTLCRLPDLDRDTDSSSLVSTDF